MGQPARVLLPPPPSRDYPALVPPPRGQFAFRSLVFTEPRSHGAGRGATLAASIVIHAVLLAVAIVTPLLFFEEALPVTDVAVRAFFTSPPEVAPPPPPPPPPPPAAMRTRSPQAVATPPPEPARFVAPVEVPDQLPPEEETVGIGVEGGVPGGVEGGVPGGVAGGIVGGLPPATTPAASGPVVRVGGNIRAPKLLYEVKPEYPPLAVQARIQAIVILDAHVGTDGRVKSVRVLRGNPVLDEAAIAAVKQRRYQPLLLNGVPTEFVLTMTMVFRLVAASPGS
jgi:protein TonB